MATQNTKTKTTLADKDKKVLMILGALVILALAWFLGYQKFNEQRETVATENDQLAMEVSQLRAKVSKKAQVEADTEKKNARTEQVLLAYPSELRTQDAINRFDQLEKKVKGLTITTENFTMNQIFFQDGAALEQVVAQNADDDAQSKDANSGNSTASGNSTVIMHRIVRIIRLTQQRMRLLLQTMHRMHSQPTPVIIPDTVRM